MISFEVNGHHYQARHLDVFDQMLMAKRLMPLAKHVITPEVLAMVLAAPSGEGSAADKEAAKGKMAESIKADAGGIIKAIADAIYALSDDDARFIVNKCLSVTQRRNTGGVYSDMVAADGSLMFDDVKLPEMLTITAKVVGGHMGDFFSTAP